MELRLGHGGWVAYSRRQVCYITAKSFFGGKLWNYDSGLFRLMKMCQGACDFRASFATLLAACSADETLADGKQGPMILVAKANVAPEVPDVRALAEDVILESSGLRICDYDAGAGDVSNVETVPVSGCVPRSATNPGVDFMTGGLEGQVTQDISASWFGGYLFDAKACGLGGGQDERLSVYFPEVTVLAYFLSRSMPYPQVRQPVWFLGARNFFKNLDGTARFDSPLVLSDIPVDDRDLETITLEGASYQIDKSRCLLLGISILHELRCSYGLSPLQRSVSALVPERSIRPATSDPPRTSLWSLGPRGFQGPTYCEARRGLHEREPGLLQGDEAQPGTGTDKSATITERHGCGKVRV